MTYEGAIEALELAVLAESNGVQLSQLLCALAVLKVDKCCVTEHPKKKPAKSECAISGVCLEDF